MNRTIAPKLNKIETINFIAPEVHPFGINSEWIWMKEAADETVRLELFFNAGTIQGERLVAGTTNALLLSGTADKSTTQIHDELAQLGAFVDTETTSEAAVVAVYCLRDKIDEVLEILVDAIENVVFPQEELEEQIRDRKQAFLVNQQKMSMLARRQFTKDFFENDDRYNRVVELEDYDQIKREDLVSFHKQYYLKGLQRVICVANLEDSLVEKWKKNFSIWSDENTIQHLTEIKNKVGVEYVNKEEAMQTAIRMGIPLFNKTHEDYAEMFVLQTILGDYFGSRLMSNLREDKGYTYGIGSGIIETAKTGYLIIGTEVKKEAQEDALVQIQNEIELLQNELVTEEELQLVKNYLIGQLLKSADGSNAMMDLFLSVHLYGLNLEYYNELIEKIYQTKPENLLNIAKKYLNNSLFTVRTFG